MAKDYNELTITDDFMFGKVMGDTELCRDVLACLLCQDIDVLTEVQIEKEYRNTYGGKRIRLDVYSQDTQNRIYDAEMQNLNHSSVEALCLPKRTRYYQSCIDTDFLEHNSDYQSLPEVVIVFICTFDPFGLNRYMYRFENRCDNPEGLVLNDSSIKYFFNTTYQGVDYPEDIQKLYQFIQRGTVSGELTSRLQKAVSEAKLNSQWKGEYMKERIILAEERRIGREEGRLTMLQSLIQANLLTISDAAKQIGMSEEDLQEALRKL